MLMTIFFSFIKIVVFKRNSLCCTLSLVFEVPDNFDHEMPVLGVSTHVLRVSRVNLIPKTCLKT